MLKNKILTVNENTFNALALEIFQFQYVHNNVYQQYCQLLNVNPGSVSSIDKIPFLPIAFFKSHEVATTDFTPEVVFESSGTTQTINSRHLVKDVGLYRESFTKAFRQFYGDAGQYCILALLPSYLERGNSSLVMMADQLIKDSKHPQSGFYLNNKAQLKDTLLVLEEEGQQTILIGVTFALLDFAEQYPMPLKNTIVMETGGMKGRRKDITRPEVHAILRAAFNLPSVHSEYGMTELLSQAYSCGEGIFNTPPWMKILVREEDDPFAVHESKPGNTISGAVNIIDLANLYSCSFIAAEDAAKLHPDNSFEILGRLDNTDIRGCSLLAI